MNPSAAAGLAALTGAVLLVVNPARPVRRPSWRRLAVLDRVGDRADSAMSSRGASEPRWRTGGAQPRASDRPVWRRIDRIRLAAVLAGLTTGALLGDWLAVPAGVAAAILLDRALRRLEPAAARQRRLREAEDLPLAADLLAAALRAGAPVEHAVSAVADALGGPLGERLGQVGRTLRLGGDPDEAWSQLAGIAGADRLARSAIRSASSGAALAGALTRLADDLRGDRATDAEAAARRAGVLIVLPLGLCFLPAFILAGLVPVIVAVLGDVL